MPRNRNYDVDHYDTICCCARCIFCTVLTIILVGALLFASSRICKSKFISQIGTELEQQRNLLLERKLSSTNIPGTGIAEGTRERKEFHCKRTEEDQKKADDNQNILASGKEKGTQRKKLKGLSKKELLQKSCSKCKANGKPCDPKCPRLNSGVSSQSLADNANSSMLNLGNENPPKLNEYASNEKNNRESKEISNKLKLHMKPMKDVTGEDFQEKPQRKKNDLDLNKTDRPRCECDKILKKK